jgi:hypothetical protein
MGDTCIHRRSFAERPIQIHMVFKILYFDDPVSPCSVSAVLIAFHLTLLRGLASENH